VLLVQLVSLYLVDAANTRNANALIGESLVTTVRSFHNSINSRNDALTLAGSTLSGDYAFKIAYATSGPETVESALTNQRLRIGADLMFLLDLSGNYQIVSGIAPGPGMQAGDPFPFADFMQALENNGEVSGIIHLNSRLYSVIGIPLLSPVPVAWVILGFEVNEAFIGQLLDESGTAITVAYDVDENYSIQVSSLVEELRFQVEEAINASGLVTDSNYEMQVGDAPYLTYISSLAAWGGEQVYAILQRDRNQALAPYFRLRVLLIVISLLALLVSLFGGAVIANTVTRPVKVLVNSAREIERGDYHHVVNLQQEDELGLLGQAFNNMSKGLYERDRVQNLLGKVISPEIAQELISSDVQLGGEEKEITILFTDLRNFTGLSENRSPSDMLDILNEYLTRMTAVIDRHGGVVDKYIGDAIMALFGAPVNLPDHPSRAVACALEMLDELVLCNASFKTRGWPELDMGIGVHSGKVIVGNMGSSDRLNYTAIGDGVNLASRLESATKDCGVPIIVSEATRNMAPDFEYQELQAIQVRGRQQAVRMFTPSVKKA